MIKVAYDGSFASRKRDSLKTAVELGGLDVHSHSEGLAQFDATHAGVTARYLITVFRSKYPPGGTTDPEMVDALNQEREFLSGADVVVFHWDSGDERRELLSAETLKRWADECGRAFSGTLFLVGADPGRVPLDQLKHLGVRYEFVPTTMSDIELLTRVLGTASATQQA